MANTRVQELGFLYIDVESFTFHACRPRIELGDTPRLVVREEYQVISVKQLARHASAELEQERLQQQDEEQWAKTEAWCTPTPTPNPSLY